uniref:V-type proton ATPase subunit G n=1 Tax=Catharus ustulatus TaxID=91951 RepID=A0A8C3TTN2_CATUS
MTSQSQGIQQLLQAEKRAKDKLEEAKKRKGKRLRQAKEEATAEIDHYRLQREKEFRNKETNVRNSKPDCFQEYYMETPANHHFIHLWHLAFFSSISCNSQTVLFLPGDLPPPVLVLFFPSVCIV